MKLTWYVLKGVMIAWTGIEHFRMGRFDPPPPATEPDDVKVSLFPMFTTLSNCFFIAFGAGV